MSSTEISFDWSTLYEQSRLALDNAEAYRKIGTSLQFGGKKDIELLKELYHVGLVPYFHHELPFPLHPVTSTSFASSSSSSSSYTFDSNDHEKYFNLLFLLLHNYAYSLPSDAKTIVSNGKEENSKKIVTQLSKMDVFQEIIHLGTLYLKYKNMNNNGKRQTDAEVLAIYDAYMARGLDAFNKDKLSSAKADFGEAKMLLEKLLPNINSNALQRRELVEKMKKECNTMIRKCDIELEDDEEEEKKKVPSIDMKKEVKTDTPMVTSTINTINTSTSTTSTTTSTATRTGIMANYSYSQNSAHTKVTIYIMQANLTAENVDIQVETKTLAVKLKDSVGGTHGNYIFNKILYDEVDPSGTSIKYKPDRLQITLKQIKAGEWPELIDKNAKPKPVSQATNNAEKTDNSQGTAKGDNGKSSMPRPYASHKNWDAIDSELTKQMEEDPELKPQGEEALNDLFRNIYKNANEETRRAMVKSFQTSGGTVLSTNWGEVSEKDYEKERTAPDGMEWKKWKDA